MDVKEFFLSFVPGSGYSLLHGREHGEHVFDEVVASARGNRTSTPQTFWVGVLLILCIALGLAGRYYISLLSNDSTAQFNWSYIIFVVFVSILAFGQFHNRFFAESSIWLQMYASLSAGTFIQSVIETGKHFLT